MSDDTPDLSMPFVVCHDQGGPYDAAAYVAGWEMGAIQAQLRAAFHHGLGLPELTIHRPNLPQLDLVAMEIGVTATEVDWPDHVPEESRDEWARVQLKWGTRL